MKKTSLFVLTALLTTLLASPFCSKKKPREKAFPVGPEKQKQILAYADPVMENILVGFNKNDYETYSRDFGNQMKKAQPEPAFQKVRQKIVGRIGLYKKHALTRIVKTGKYYIVIYAGEFEKEKGVQMRLVFNKNDASHKVAGLWFNSPGLRRK